MKFFRQTAVLFAAVLALLGNRPIASAQVQQGTTASTGTKIVGDPNPMLDEMMSLPVEKRNLTSDTFDQLTPYATAKPNFGGFRVAPYTPAHQASNTNRIISSVEADFNNDGKMDIVAFQSNALALMAGDGKGGFTRAAAQTTALNVFHPIAVDLNKDGYPDIVAMTLPFSYLGTVVVLMNQKDGTFAAPVVISHKASVYSGLTNMNVVDVDGDGNYDVIISGTGTVDTMTNSYVVFETIFGNGDGTFRTSAPKDTVATIPYKDTIGYDGGTILRKVNGSLVLYAAIQQAHTIDGIGYAATLLYQFPVGTDGTVNVGGAAVSQIVEYAANTCYLSFKDVNQDGVDDLVYLAGDGQVYVYPGKSDGTFGTAIAALPGGFTATTAVVSFADVDKDGKLDLILAGGSLLAVYPGNGDGTFRIPTATYVGGFGTAAVSGITYPIDGNIVDDFDGDGTPDIVYFDTSKRTLAFYKGKSDGTYYGANAQVSANGNYPTSVFYTYAVPDLNGDGVKDVLANSGYGLLTGINDGKGNFTYKIAAPALVGISSISSFTADFNKDGKDDVLLETYEGSSYKLYIGFSNGDGSLNTVKQTLPFTPSILPGIQVADLNGDGYPDVVLTLTNYTTGTYGVWTMMNDGKGNLVPGQFINTGVYVYAVGVGDVTNDGYPELFIASGTYYITPVGEWINDGTGHFKSAADRVIQSTLPVSQILVREATGDGNRDLLLAISNGTSEGLQLYPGAGDGTFAAAQQLAVGLVVSGMAVNDYNGDGVPDIVFTNAETVLADSNDNQLGMVLLRGAGNGTFATPLAFGVYGASSIFHSVDLEGSGSLSILADGGAGTTILHNVGATSLTLKAAKTLGAVNATYPVTVTVAPYFTDQAIPTGTIAVLVDNTSVATGTLSANGSVTVNLTSLSAGTHTVTATYSGDSNFNANIKSPSASIVVTKITPLFSLSSSTATLHATNGATVAATLSLSANDAFAGPVALSCSGMPMYATCSFDQANVTLAPGQTSTAKMSIVTQSQAANHAPPLPGSGPIGMALAGLLVTGLLARRRRSIPLLAVTLSLAAMSIVGCSSGGSATKKAATGTYAVTVTATPGDTTVSSQTLVVAVNIQ